MKYSYEPKQWFWFQIFWSTWACTSFYPFITSAGTLWVKLSFLCSSWQVLSNLGHGIRSSSFYSLNNCLIPSMFRAFLYLFRFLLSHAWKWNYRKGDWINATKHLVISELTDKQRNREWTQHDTLNVGKVGGKPGILWNSMMQPV